MYYCINTNKELYAFVTKIERDNKVKFDPDFVVCDARPSVFHDWSGSAWVLDSEKQFNQLKKIAIDRVYHFAEEKRKLIAGTNDLIEISAWSNKLRIANEIINNTASELDIKSFELEIKSRAIEGETLISFCNKIITKSIFFTKANSLIDGVRKNTIGLINKCSNTEDINKILQDMEILANQYFSDLLNNKI